MAVFEIVVCSILSAYAGVCITIIVSGVTEMYHLKKDIKRLEEQLKELNEEE